MKTNIITLAALALTCSLSSAESENKPQGPQRGQGQKPNPAKMIERLDKDGNGSISKEEFLAGERAQRNPEMAAKVFGKLDADSSGDITREEFAKRPKPGAQRGQREGRPNGQGQRLTQP